MNTVKLGFATFPCCGMPHLIYASKHPDIDTCKAEFANGLIQAEPGHDGKALHSMLAEIPMYQFMQLAALVLDIDIEPPSMADVRVARIGSKEELMTLLDELGIPAKTPTHDAPGSKQ